jgi:hypothetical protein
VSRNAPRKALAGPPPPPYLPADYDLADVAAVQAVATWTASAEQQQRAVKWIVENVCETYGLGWHPDGDHASSFVAGRRFVGLQIVKAVNINLSVLRKAEEHG